MMQINKSNYEIWVIDWLDGKLDEERVVQLYQFFKENPDLKEESDDFDTLKIAPSQEKFRNKKNLKKTPANITESQFDFLCAAYLENDLDEAQIKELEESISGNTGRSESFELLKRMKLVPLNVTYNGKDSLIRKTFAQKAIRLVYVGLTAAAIILFAVLTSVSRQPSLPLQTGKLAEATSPEKKITDDLNNSNTGSPLNKKTVQSRNSTKAATDVKPATNQNISRESIPEPRFAEIEKISISPEIALLPESLPAKLIAYNPDPVVIIMDEETEDNTRTKVGKFLSRAFRQRILREEAPADTPLKAYEIAEAGVSGLNKILGWQMALDQKTDESGNPKSVYFSSKILKINAPVKKSEPVQ